MLARSEECAMTSLLTQPYVRPCAHHGIALSLRPLMRISSLLAWAGGKLQEPWVQRTFCVPSPPRTSSSASTACLYSRFNASAGSCAAATQPQALTRSDMAPNKPHAGLRAQQAKQGPSESLFSESLCVASQELTSKLNTLTPSLPCSPGTVEATNFRILCPPASKARCCV